MNTNQVEIMQALNASKVSENAWKISQKEIYIP
jgi:hypothetical protein